MFQPSSSNSLIIHQVKTTKIKTVIVFGYLILIGIDFNEFCFSVSFLALVLIEKIYQTIQTMFNQMSKHLIHQKYSVGRRILKSLLDIWKWDQNQSSVFDLLNSRPL